VQGLEKLESRIVRAISTSSAVAVEPMWTDKAAAVHGACPPVTGHSDDGGSGESGRVDGRSIATQSGGPYGYRMRPVDVEYGERWIQRV
jgi:hypothetical protein